MPADPTAKDPRDLTWLTIDDFRPGIISQSRFSATPVPGTPGAAQEVGTYGCMALPNGGLAPGPKLAATILPPAGPVIDAADNYIDGAVGYFQNLTDNVLYGLEVNNSGTRHFNLVLEQVQVPYQAVVTTITGAWTGSTAQIFGLEGGSTRVNVATPGNLGTPCIALSWCLQTDTGTTSHLWLFPDPTGAAGNMNLYSVNLGALTEVKVGHLVLHQNRIIDVPFRGYSFPWAGGFNALGLLGSDEEFYYTEPPNSAAMGTQDEVFVQEEPYGIGAFGSINAGELICVKHNGGGFLISGDLNTPVVTYLGGVQPTHGLECQADSTVIGFVYLSQLFGAWVWTGGSSSQKLSRQLRDDFYEVGASRGAIVGNSAVVAAWGDLIFFSNNWLYDTGGDSWWRLDNVAVPFVWAAKSGGGRYLYCLPGKITSHLQPVIYQFDRSSPALAFQWKSYPMPETRWQLVDIMACAVRAIGIGTVTITVTGRGGDTKTKVLNFNSLTQPDVQLGSLGLTDATDVTVTIASAGTGGNPAPTVYSVGLGYKAGLPASAS